MTTFNLKHGSFHSLVCIQAWQCNNNLSNVKKPYLLPSAAQIVLKYIEDSLAFRDIHKEHELHPDKTLFRLCTKKPFFEHYIHGLFCNMNAYFENLGLDITWDALFHGDGHVKLIKKRLRSKLIPHPGRLNLFAPLFSKIH